MKDVTRRIKALRDFFRTGIWDVSMCDLKPGRRLLVVSSRIVSITFRKYRADNCPLKSSALTFYALMSIVPVAAVAFAIAKGFGFQKLFEQRLMENAAGQEEVVAQVIEFSRRLLENTQGGLLAGVGVVVLLWSVIKMLDNIEQSFNDIWGVKKARSFGRKFSDYLSVMLIAPVLLIVSGSATVMVMSEVTSMTGKLGLGFLNILMTVVMSILSYCLLWLLFAFMYLFIPNTRINIASGLIAGVVAGTLFEIVQRIYIYFQVGVAHYNAVYGSFAALPLFLAWLQLSWLIVLFGAELSYAHQNAELYESELDLNKYSRSLKNLIGLIIACLVVKNFIKGARALSVLDISGSLCLPFTLVKSTLAELCETGILIEVAPDDQANPAYQPARDPGSITAASVIEALEDRGIGAIPMPANEEMERIGGVLKEFRQTLEKSSVNVLLREI
jgi:membrane protein